MKGAIQAISELALWVKDLDRAVAFYEQLGFEVESFDAGQNAFLRSGDFLLVLFHPENPGTQLASEYMRNKGGPRGDVYHVGFKIPAERLDEFAESLKSANLSVRGPVEFSNGRRSYFVEDPDEHLIELTDR
jgi:catechol 2,3-dioxygenase-like lactoylglutathione lyase family enzyme